MSAAWPNLHREGRLLFSRNAQPGRSWFGEERRSWEGSEYRAWDPWRSKLAAYILKGGPPLALSSCRSVLYLGAAHGQTVSHLCDLIPEVPVFAVEKSPSAFASLLALARERTNLLPLLADAHLPERYRAEVGLVDLVYQDVAQRDQDRIFLENTLACLRTGGEGLWMLKARSVTQRRPVGQVLQEARRALAAQGLQLRGQVALEPFARDHVALVVGG